MFDLLSYALAKNKAKAYADELALAGENAYVHIKYSLTEPNENADMMDTPSAWMGVYSGTSATAPTVYTAYSWYNIKGAGGSLAYVDVADVSDAFACDVDSQAEVRFALVIADTDAKVVTFSNVPTGRCEVELEITTSAVGSVTWTLNEGSSLAWVNGAAPTLASGKVYRIVFYTSDNGATWDAYPAVGV